MNPLALLQVPWRSAHRSLRWLSVVVFVLCLSGAIAIGTLVAKPERWVGAITLYGFGLLYLWAFFFSTCLLLAIDMRQLRVPAVQSHIVLSLLLYGALTIGLPAGVMAMFDLPVWNAVVVLALFGACGLVFALLPRFVAVFIGLMPSLLTALWRRFDLPGMADPRFAHWGFFVVLIMLATVILRWRQLLLAGPNVSMGWSSPMVIQFRSGSWGQWNNIGDNRMLRQRPDWLRPVIDFDHVGPANPRKALRIALGGWYLPQTMRSYLKQLALLICIVLLPMIGSLLLTRSGHLDAHVGEIAKGALLGAFGSLSVIAGPMICLLTMVWISKRWQRASAELSLLALLPGLGSPIHAKQSLLRVGLGLPLLMHALLALPAVVAMLWWQSHAVLLSFMLLAQLGAATITVAIVLNLFGGRALTTPAISLMLTAVFVLTVLSLFLPTTALGNHPMSWAASLLPPLAIAWLLLVATMSWLGRRGWRDLMQQPHPFLVH
ncbi:hypothetical protein [Rhodanobacter sp. C03]|uniref:hypothetical protein n=1 Tax=Rhodanobacter sp. C03 TaxID=1945858 RepID=UPI0009878D75|nr:hypothetical protein [Rhodanobacter sp. C03]OOG53266.1 hypothetical protein B0E48_16410 [Rhodanobacter sp. C03]